MPLDIELLVTPDCPHAGATEALVRDVAAELAPAARIRLTEVGTIEDAERLGFPGSPTVRVDGDDLEGAAVGPAAVGCRLYGGGDGVPPRWLLEARMLRARSPGHILFLCVANSARSQMAEGIARALASGHVHVSSAGSEPSRVNPFAMQALEEIGIDPSGHRSEGTDEIAARVERSELPAVDAVITLCAEEVCPVWLHDAARAHWPHPDPAAITGSNEEILASFRQVRDQLRPKLEALLEQSAVDPFNRGSGT